MPDYKSKARAALTLDGQPMAGPLPLAAGPHVVRLKAQFRNIAEPGVRLWLRNPSTDALELLQFSQPPPDAGTL